MLLYIWDLCRKDRLKWAGLFFILHHKPNETPWNIRAALAIRPSYLRSLMGSLAMNTLAWSMS